jgi:hypothetical protein
MNQNKIMFPNHTAYSGLPPTEMKWNTEIWCLNYVFYPTYKFFYKIPRLVA